MSIKDIIIYTMSFSSITLLLVYIFPLAKILSNQPKLTNEYYYKNFVFNYFFDYFLVAAYLFIFFVLKKNNKLNDHILLSLICISISTISYILIVQLFKNTKTFFYRWFTKAGLIVASTYDIILVNSIYLLYSHLQQSL